MSTSTSPINLTFDGWHRVLRDHVDQIRLYQVGTGTEEPTQLVKTSDFDQHWKAILDPSGDHIDESGRRVAVRRNNDDEDEPNDVHWAAHNVAKFWSARGRNIPLLGPWNEPRRPNTISWQMHLTVMRRTCREDVRELAFQKMIQMKAQADTRTTVVIPPNAYPYPGLLSDPSAIRLVVLLSAEEKHADIVCVLCNSTLSRSDSSPYEALSYVWGNSSKRKSITVNGRQFQATENLELALRNLRYRDKHRVLWIDSMCINQNDVMERNTQVQQMDCIYKKAQRVIVWLGPESETSSNAFHFFQDGPIALWEPNDDPVYEQYRDALIASVDAVHHFAKRPWFTRVWCVQEFILGQHVMFQCGQQIAPWELFESPLNYRAEIGSQGMALEEQHIYSFRNLVKLFGWKRETPKAFESVLSLLNAFREWSSSDPRDRIFAFYGLVPTESPDRDFLKPDYSLSTSEVYIRFAVQYLRAHRELDILSVATYPVEDYFDMSRVHFLPCWVPDWRDGQHFGAEIQYRPIACSGLGTRIYAFDKLYDAALGLKATSLDFEDDFQILCLDGIEVDTIEDIGALSRGRKLPYRAVCNLFSKWKELAGLSAGGDYQHTGQPLREAFWRTVLMDYDLNLPTKGTRQRSRIPATNAKLDWLPHFPPSVQDEEELFVQADAYKHGPTNGRRFFKTSKGLIGLAPASAQKGDSIVVLFGGKVPFVMRTFEEWHHLVGECYVHGIMHGEVVHQPRTEVFRNLKVEKFRLT